LIDDLPLISYLRIEILFFCQLLQTYSKVPSSNSNQNSLSYCVTEIHIYFAIIVDGGNDMKAEYEMAKDKISFNQR
jgi:hypothetical protein